MRAEKYTNKKGQPRFRPVCTEEEVTGADGTGFCLGCGGEASCCEPDARKYTCEGCGENLVYGLEELVLIGLLKIEGDEEEAVRS